MTKNPRGRAIIIHNYTYPGGNREGSEVDKQNLCRLFKALYFTIDEETNIWKDCHSEVEYLYIFRKSMVEKNCLS